MKSLYTVLLFSIFNFQFTATKAQTVRVFSKTGIPKGTYSTVAAALATTTDGDSLVLSAHTFKESRLKGNYSVVYQGTIAGGDTTTIDAMGNGSVFDFCKGVIRDLIITGAKEKKFGVTLSGGGINYFDGKICGNTIIRNNIGPGVGGVYINEGTIEGNVKILNNISTQYYGGVGVYKNCRITGNVIISENRGVEVGGIRSPGCTKSNSLTNFLIIEGNVYIKNNYGDTAGAICIKNQSSCKVEIKGATIINNKAWKKNAASIYSETINISLPLDSIIVPEIRIINSRIYNPNLDFSRQAELMIVSRPKSAKVYSEGCWWGSNDTTGLIVVGSGTDFTMPNWAVTRWYGVPFGTSGSQVRAQMQLNTGAALPPNCFKGLEGKFTATSGSFPSPTSVINAGNLIASDYYYPASGPFAITASVDADTFRTNNKGALGIAERGFEQFKIYPNPFVSELRAEGLPLYSMIRLYDAQGKMVYYRYAEESQCSLSLGHLPAGQYSLKITSADGQVGSTKLTKE